MSELKGKIDFTLFISANNANPNGDPLNGNRPRINMDGFGEISEGAGHFFSLQLHSLFAWFFLSF
mgnify:CR=1 FL=1